MKKITLKIFETLIVNNMSSNNKVPSIASDNIKEFKIGKSYLYKLKDEHLIKIHIFFHNYFQKNIPLNNASVGFIKNHSYLDFFEPHIKNYNFIRLDIRSFFHSIDIEDIRETFKSYFEEIDIDKEKEQSILDAFINIVTYEIPKDSLNDKFKGKRVLPMGFKTSPIISNIVFRQLDIQIQKLCSEKNIIYTRYADDMLFSSSKDLLYIHSDGFIKEIRIIIGQMSFKLNEHKTLKAKHTLSLNGYTIEYGKNELRLSNKKTDVIKKMICMILKEEKAPNIILKKLFNYKLKFKCNKNSYEKYNTEQLLHKVLGYRSYLLSVIQFNKKYQCTQEDTIEKYLSIIDDLEKIAEKYQIKIDELEKIITKNKK